MIDPGHPSENGNGAFGICGISEHAITLEYGLDLVGLFFDDSVEEDEWYPYATRNDLTTTVTNPRRVEMANNESNSEVDAYGDPIPLGGVDYFFSIHCNYSANSSVNGTEIYWYDFPPNTTPENGLTSQAEQIRTLKSRNAADYVLPWYMTMIRQYHNSSLGYQFSARSRGVKPDTLSGAESIYVLRRTIMPSVLIELEFITNSEACQLVSNTNGDYYIQGLFALYDANKYLNPQQSEFLDHVIDGNIMSFTQISGAVLIKNTTVGQVNQVYDVTGTSLVIGDPLGPETNVSIEKNLTIRGINGGFIDCGDPLDPIYPVTIYLDDRADIMCDIGGSLTINKNVVLNMAGDHSCLLANNGGVMKIDEKLILYSGFIEVGKTPRLRLHQETIQPFKALADLMFEKGQL